MDVWPPGVDAHGLTWAGVVFLCWCSPFWVALSSFLTPECLLHGDGAWVDASQERHIPQGVWVSHSLTCLCCSLFWISIWTVGHRDSSFVRKGVLVEFSLRNAAYFMPSPESSLKIMVPISTFMALRSWANQEIGWTLLSAVLYTYLPMEQYLHIILSDAGIQFFQVASESSRVRSVDEQVNVREVLLCTVTVQGDLHLFLRSQLRTALPDLRKLKLRWVGTPV